MVAGAGVGEQFVKRVLMFWETEVLAGKGFWCLEPVSAIMCEVA